MYQQAFPIILASKSPRRQELLSAMNLNFKVMLKDVDESYPERLLPADIAVYIAEKKAAAQVLYMGDDIPDLKIMQLVGLPTCPADAVPEIKAISTYISPYTGGKTAVRDIIEKVLRVQQQWFDENPAQP
jgi:uncharacterized protein with von Willebrand factor type A (vWA) domain